MQQALPFVKSKRSEMTFGYLPEYVLSDLVPDMTGSAQFYTEAEVRNKMMEMDAGFVGMRRSTIDLTEAVRQLIFYMVVVKFVKGVPHVAVYQRAAGSEAKLKDGFSFGLGGHVETIDLAPHTNIDENGNVIEHFNECPSSYFSTMHSGLRELTEEIQLLLPVGQERPMDGQEMGNAIMNELGLTQLQATMAQSSLDDYREGALMSEERYVVIRDESDDTRGLLVFVQPTPVDVVYRDLFKAEPLTRNVTRVDADLLPCGFLSDIKPEQKGFIGNTHLAVLGVICVPDELEFEIKESNYTTIGWMNKEQVEEMAGRFEPWSKILIPHFDQLAEVAKDSPYKAEDAQV